MSRNAVLALLLFAVSLPVCHAADALPQRAVARIGDYRFYHGPGIRMAALSPDGKHIASLRDSDVIVLWDTGTGERFRKLRFPETRFDGVHRETVHLTAVSPLERESVRCWGERVVWIGSDFDGLLELPSGRSSVDDDRFRD